MQDSAIWTEKYRPIRFDEIIGQDKIVERTKAFVIQKNMPNLLFAGPPGVGKSTLSLVIAKELYGASWRDNFLELNASDDRGIDIVRHTIKDFSRTKALANVPFKIIFLDECDSLTKEAQQALRRTMENYTNVTRFILSCNYSSKIIDPIISRCSVFRFKPIVKEDIKKIINLIEKSEKLKISEGAKDSLINLSSGDVRKLQNILQMVSATQKDISEKSLYEILGQATPKEIQECLIFAIKGDFLKARDKLLDTMLRYGLSGIDIIKQIQKQIWDLNIKDEQKLKLIDKCAEIEFRMVEGSDEFVQLEALLSNFIPIKS